MEPQPPDLSRPVTPLAPPLGYPARRTAPSPAGVLLWGGVFGLAFGLPLAFVNAASGYVLPSFLLQQASTVVIALPATLIAGFLAALVAKRALAGLVAGALAPLVGGLRLVLAYTLVVAQRFGLPIKDMLLDAGLTLILTLVGAGLGMAAGLLGRTLAGRK